jgi:glycosyltransferase involved in cell wall biosynthesis
MEINIFTLGDANDINTWSNVPFFFSKALRDENVLINQINIQPNRYIKRIYKYSISLPLQFISKIFGTRYDFNYFRSNLNKYLINRKIKRYCIKYSEANCNIFLSFSFSSHNYSKIPVIHLCDQLYEEIFINRQLVPSKLDRVIINNELEILRNARFVYSTNIKTINLLQEKYKIILSEELKYRINLDTKHIFIDETHILRRKQELKKILFIGKSFHDRGVDVLLEAFRAFNSKQNYSYKLFIVGPVVKQIDKTSNSNVHYYEYLDKSIPSEYNTYLELLYDAMMFVFPMRYGPIPAALFEANFFFTPSIVTNIHGIGEDIKNYENGILIDQLDVGKFEDAMLELSMDLEMWKTLAINAHEYSKNFTLEALAQTIIKEINSF